MTDPALYVWHRRGPLRTLECHQRASLVAQVSRAGWLVWGDGAKPVAAGPESDDAGERLAGDAARRAGYVVA